MAKAKFTAGGPRQAVYDALQSRGFAMSKWSDKQWTRGGITAHVYGAGSMLELARGCETLINAPMAESLAWLDATAPA